jgi:hypothetical protein
MDDEQTMKPAKETQFKARLINQPINWAIEINQLFNQVQLQEEQVVT